MRIYRFTVSPFLLLVVTAAAYAQDITVTGTVTDASTGEGIAGATILLQGDATRWVMTDAMGAYTISVPSDGVLEVRFMRGRDAR